MKHLTRIKLITAWNHIITVLRRKKENNIRSEKAIASNPSKIIRFIFLISLAVIIVLFFMSFFVEKITFIDFISRFSVLLILSVSCYFFIHFVKRIINIQPNSRISLLLWVKYAIVIGIFVFDFIVISYLVLFILFVVKVKLEPDVFLDWYKGCLLPGFIGGNTGFLGHVIKLKMKTAKGGINETPKY